MRDGEHHDGGRRPVQSNGARGDDAVAWHADVEQGHLGIGAAYRGDGPSRI